MGGFLAHFVEHLGLERPLVVAPDVGTPAALFMAAARPELTAGLVVGSGGVAWPIQLTGPLAEWVFAPDLDHYRTIDPDVFVNAALGTIAGYDVPDEIRTITSSPTPAIASSSR
jgi:pimeloyl-ACP methyl ester carboxylesterase